jgi:hypothetical protein
VREAARAKEAHFEVLWLWREALLETKAASRTRGLTPRGGELLSGHLGARPGRAQQALKALRGPCGPAHPQYNTLQCIALAVGGWRCVAVAASGGRRCCSAARAVACVAGGGALGLCLGVESRALHMRCCKMRSTNHQLRAPGEGGRRPASRPQGADLEAAGSAFF